VIAATFNVKDTDGTDAALTVALLEGVVTISQYVPLPATFFGIDIRERLRDFQREWDEQIPWSIPLPLVPSMAVSFHSRTPGCISGAAWRHRRPL